MSSIFSNEFYERLHNLEAKYHIDEWGSTLVDDDPELLWCQQYIKDHLDTQSAIEKDNFKTHVEEEIMRGNCSVKKLAKKFGMSEGTMRKKIDECHLTKFWLMYRAYLNGVVVYNDDEMMFVKDKHDVADLLGMANTHSVYWAIRNDRKINSYHVVPVKRWRMVYPDLDINMEECLYNDVIKIA